MIVDIHLGLPQLSTCLKQIKSNKTRHLHKDHHHYFSDTVNTVIHVQSMMNEMVWFEYERHFHQVHVQISINKTLTEIDKFTK